MRSFQPQERNKIQTLTALILCLLNNRSERGQTDKALNGASEVNQSKVTCPLTVVFSKWKQSPRVAKLCLKLKKVDFLCPQLWFNNNYDYNFLSPLYYGHRKRRKMIRVR